ncbi:zinc finger protein 436-like isoform X5 [Frankliniella occidentalis]|uniref:Zinc finger protein 436-like isoform X3 n=1 Tax=Frankliniella occidentalis TaxID=133901 RepID=A0A6J1RTK1_FRAOC|nr:zinc finger protein 436-like isoform X3 [Frankliniella occidentalis]XP_052120517.1 zinc finger protein 436-like isoform X4 [Frankliniella occidentalis]XP_052120518.1 zinc finger protein 436-like isoform X5 [Frankliniella occidentalis]
MLLDAPTMCRGNEKPFEAFGDDDGVGRLHSGLQCSQCPITFKSHSLLRRHLIRAHEEVMLYGCTDCLRMFTSVYELQEHRSTAHINGCGDLLKKSFDCTECPETFERRSDWLRHFRIHRGSRPYKCTECWKTFRESSDLRNHLFDHTKELCDSFSNDSNDSCFATSDELEDITDVTSGDSLHLNSTKIVDDISDHISLDLTEPTSDGMDDSMNYCDLTDSLRDDLSDGGFSEWSGALRQLHFRKNSKPHKCPMCRLRFRQVNHLLRHLDTHLPNRPYKCLECNQSFKRSDHLRRHMLTHNAREKPFRCSQCPEQFVSAHYLGRHMRSHAGDKPYSCKYCEYNFRSPSSLERHLRVHNDKTSKRLGTTPNSKTFKCTECLLKFRKKKSLMKHLLEHLGR